MSTLAQRIALRLDLPCHGLDTIVWQEGWRKTPEPEKERKIRELAQANCWVIDGVSLTAQDAADTVVFLDVRRRVSLLRVAKRNWRYLFRSRPGLPPRCPEILILPKLIQLIWRFPRVVRPRIIERMNAGDGSQRCFHLRTASDVEQFLAGLAASRATDA